MKPLISIVVPVYKVEQYLDRCVKSIVNQTYRNLEIILVDDGSPDNCPEMCDAWAAKDSRIKVIHKENGGVSSARNAALDAAKGEYIGFVDSDDYIESNMFEVLLKNLIDNNADISVCGYQINDENDGEFNVRTVSQSDALKLVCIGDYKYGVLWNKLYKKTVVENVKMPDLKYSEDLVYNYFAFVNAKRIVESDLKLYHYFQNSNSAVHNSFNKANYDAVKARKILVNNFDDDMKKYAVYGYILSCYVFLNEIIDFGECTEMFGDVRNDILSHKKEIFFSALFSKKEKIKTFLLLLSPYFYKKIYSKFK